MDALRELPHLTLCDCEVYAEAVDDALVRLLRCGRLLMRALLVSRWGGALGAAQPTRVLAAALARHPSLLRLDLDDGTFTAAGASSLFASPICPSHAYIGP